MLNLNTFCPLSLVLGYKVLQEMLFTNLIFWIAEIGCVVVGGDIWIAPNLCLSDDW
jgi:hypothetical protein